MNKPFILLLFFCSSVLPASLQAQAFTEFEGVITYAHQVTAISNDYNIDNDFEYIGRQSEFFYKAGKYKWLNQGAFMEMDMFRTRDTIEFLKMRSTDTILYAPNNFSNETVTEYKILKNADTVSGHICNILIIKATSPNGNDWTRKYSFSDDFPVNAALFENYKYNSTNTIYKLMNALPLKIELIYPNRKVIYTAIKIEKKPVADSFFEFKPKTKFKSLM